MAKKITTPTDEKYARLVREIVTPTNWYIFPGREAVPSEHREQCIEAGIKRFDELFSQGKHWKAADMGADAAIRAKAGKLREQHRAALDRIKPTIQARIRELIEGIEEPGSFEMGYQVADALKADGYTWEQVRWAEDMSFPTGLRHGIQIRYTGLYD
jgi:hypothetical protein